MKRLLPILLLLTACERPESKAPSTPVPASVANPARGQALIAEYGCLMCHLVPGVPGQAGSLGPSLEGIGSRPAISLGSVQNTPDNLARFIQNPQSVNPQSSMPPSNATEADARDIAAYLSSLK
jgi:cytochrome c1